MPGTRDTSALRDLDPAGVVMVTYGTFQTFILKLAQLFQRRLVMLFILITQTTLNVCVY